MDTGHDLAGANVARNNRSVATIELFGCSVELIESQASFTRFGIGSVTSKTVVRQNRADVSIEVDCFFRQHSVSGQCEHRDADSELHCEGVAGAIHGGIGCEEQNYSIALEF